jgi:hypothetical protein
MDTDASGTEAISNEEAHPGKTGRPPPIILTSATNLIQVQKELKIVVNEKHPKWNQSHSQEAFRISSPSNPTSMPITCPITPTPNPKNL